jgi:hypothetical protein
LWLLEAMAEVPEARFRSEAACSTPEVPFRTLLSPIAVGGFSGGCAPEIVATVAVAGQPYWFCVTGIDWSQRRISLPTRKGSEGL